MWERWLEKHIYRVHIGMMIDIDTCDATAA